MISRAAALALCAPSIMAVTPATAMVGAAADPAPAARHTVMVLFHKGAEAGFCSAIVLAQDVVLTAAHCLPKGADIRIHLPGSGAEPKLLTISAVARNPDYRPDAVVRRERSIDLALVQLAKPLPDSFAPATIARAGKTRVGERFVASGFGVSREGDAPSSGTLRSATLAARAPLSDVLLWAEDPTQAGAGACTGDSGGPISVEGRAEVSALTVWSAGDGAKQCGTLTQAAWLGPQQPWIDRVMQAWRSQH